MENKPFGMAHYKAEGAPVHPDDMRCKTKRQYQKQLDAYNDWYGQDATSLVSETSSPPSKQ